MEVLKNVVSNIVNVLISKGSFVNCATINKYRPTLTANANNTEDDEIARRMRFAAQHYHKQIAFKNE